MIWIVVIVKVEVLICDGKELVTITGNYIYALF